jgi:hypothetical protein
MYAMAPDLSILVTIPFATFVDVAFDSQPLSQPKLIVSYTQSTAQVDKKGRPITASEQKFKEK